LGKKSEKIGEGKYKVTYYFTPSKDCESENLKEQVIESGSLKNFNNQSVEVDLATKEAKLPDVTEFASVSTWKEYNEQLDKQLKDSKDQFEQTYNISGEEYEAFLDCGMPGGFAMYLYVLDFQSEVQTEATEQAQKIAGCAGASLTIDLTDIKPTWYSAQNATRVVVRNGSDRDLNTFRITAIYSDGSSDLNVVSLDLEQYSAMVVWTKGSPEAGVTKPERVVIESVECGTQVEVLGENIETG
jgi:hypothetical protein